jgi:hypothetical protein
MEISIRPFRRNEEDQDEMFAMGANDSRPPALTFGEVRRRNPWRVAGAIMRHGLSRRV